MQVGRGCLEVARMADELGGKREEAAKVTYMPRRGRRRCTFFSTCSDRLDLIGKWKYNLQIGRKQDDIGEMK